jgi:hypothetical protein
VHSPFSLWPCKSPTVIPPPRGVMCTILTSKYFTVSPNSLSGFSICDAHAGCVSVPPWHPGDESIESIVDSIIGACTVTRTCNIFACSGRGACLSLSAVIRVTVRPSFCTTSPGEQSRVVRGVENCFLGFLPHEQLKVKRYYAVISGSGSTEIDSVLSYFRSSSS